MPEAELSTATINASYQPYTRRLSSVRVRPEMRTYNICFSPVAGWLFSRARILMMMLGADAS